MVVILAFTLIILCIVLCKRSKRASGVPCPQSKSNIGSTSQTSELQILEDRMDRHRRVWSVLRFMITYTDLMNSTDFYSYKKNRGLYEEAFVRMHKEHIKPSDIEIAIRFCRAEYYNGTCQHEITAEDIKRLNEWQDIQIDEELLLNNILTSYQTYWDNVIKSYKRPSARKNRLQYLVNNTDDILKLPSVQKYPAFTVKVKTLQNHYRHLISGE